METGLQWRRGMFHDRGMCSSDTPFPAGAQASNLDSIDSMDSVFFVGGVDHAGRCPDPVFSPEP